MHWHWNNIESGVIPNMSKESNKQVQKRNAEAIWIWSSDSVLYLIAGTLHDTIGDHYQT